MEFNGIFALAAAKPTMNALIPSIIIVTLGQSKSAKFCKFIVKAAVCEALAPSVG
jgi:hypothetical protein